MIKVRYAALGLQEKPETVGEIETAFYSRMEHYKDSKRKDRAARRLLREARDICISEVKNGSVLPISAD